MILVQFAEAKAGAPSQRTSASKLRSDDYTGLQPAYEGSPIQGSHPVEFWLRLALAGMLVAWESTDGR